LKKTTLKQTLKIVKSIFMIAQLFKFKIKVVFEIL